MSCRMTSETNAADLNVVPAGRPSRRKQEAALAGTVACFPRVRMRASTTRTLLFPPFALETIDVWETKPKIGNPLLDPTTRL